MVRYNYVIVVKTLLYLPLLLPFSKYSTLCSCTPSMYFFALPPSVSSIAILSAPPCS